MGKVFRAAVLGMSILSVGIGSAQDLPQLPQATKPLPSLPQGSGMPANNPSTPAASPTPIVTREVPRYYEQVEVNPEELRKEKAFKEDFKSASKSLDHFLVNDELRAYIYEPSIGKRIPAFLQSINNTSPLEGRQAPLQLKGYFQTPLALIVTRKPNECKSDQTACDENPKKVFLHVLHRSKQNRPTLYEAVYVDGGRPGFHKDELRDGTDKIMLRGWETLRNSPNPDRDKSLEIPLDNLTDDEYGRINTAYRKLVRITSDYLAGAQSGGFYTEMQAREFETVMDEVTYGVNRFIDQHATQAPSEKR